MLNLVANNYVQEKLLCLINQATWTEPNRDSTLLVMWGAELWPVVQLLD